MKQELSPRIEGVLVIADGGDNAIVIENITEAVQALFGVDTHKIKVMKHMFNVMRLTEDDQVVWFLKTVSSALLV